MLHADVAQGSEHFLAKEEVPGSRPGIRSQGALDQLAGVTALRPLDVRVRIPRALRRSEVELAEPGARDER